MGNKLSAGFTLLELVIGLAISLFIGVIAATYLVSSSQVFKINANEGKILENSLFAMHILSTHIRRAGMDMTSLVTNSVAGVYNQAHCPDKDGEGSTTACAIDELDGSSDRLSFDYITESGLGCNNTKVDEKSHIVDVFWLHSPIGTDVTSLYCQTYLITDGVAATEGNAAPLVDGIDMLQAQYGVDTTGDFIINSYLRISEITDVTTIRSVRIALLLSSGIGQDTERNTEIETVRTYTLLDKKSEAFTDRIQRQIYSTTILLPNAFHG